MERGINLVWLVWFLLRRREVERVRMMREEIFMESKSWVSLNVVGSEK